jgi:hypothetical protein
VLAVAEIVKYNRDPDVDVVVVVRFTFCAPDAVQGPTVAVVHEKL